jgi:hypothetical protein
MSNKSSAGYKFGHDILGPLVISIIVMFIWALPVWFIWNNSVHIIFNLSTITYLQSVSLCALIWCFGGITKWLK